MRPPSHSTLVQWLLAPFSGLYALGWLCYEQVYGLGFKHAAEPHTPVICVGNLLVGGTGKTPLTISVAKVLLGLGRQVVISVSGYGSPSSEAAQLAPAGPLGARQWGDEAAMIRWLLPEVPLIVGRRRVLAAELCHDRFRKSILLLDDGFQHLPLKKDLTILLDPDGPSSLCLPAGPYREPRRTGRKRASLVIPSRQFRLERGPITFWTADLQPIPPPGKANALCAIGDPERFRSDLKKAGIKLDLFLGLGDHDPLSAGNLLSKFQTEETLIVTAKDWVKLRERADLVGRDIIIASYEATIAPADIFREWLIGQLNEISS